MCERRLKAGPFTFRKKGCVVGAGEVRLEGWFQTPWSQNPRIFSRLGLWRKPAEDPVMEQLAARDRSLLVVGLSVKQLGQGELWTR